MPEQPFLTIFFKKQCFKKSHLNTNEERGWFPMDPNLLIFWEVGHKKIKSNRWGERSPKKRNLHRSHSLQKFSKYKKTTEIYRLGSNRSPVSSQRVKKLFNQYSTEPLKIFKRESLVSNTNDATLKAILKHRNHPSIITIQNKCKDKGS